MHFKIQKSRNNERSMKFKVIAPNIWFNFTLIAVFGIFRFFGINNWEWYWIISPLWISILIPIFWFLLFMIVKLIAYILSSLIVITLWFTVFTYLKLKDTFRK